MTSKLLYWWQKAKKPLEVAVVSVLIIGFIALVIIIILGYIFNWSWTGLGPYSPPSKASGFQPGKRLWDWLQLLIIPAVLAIGGYAFTYTTSRNERKAADRHNQTEREIAQDNQREAALQEYIDKMSELLLDKDHPLRESAPEDEVRKIARVRTLTILPRLDSQRKGSVVQFLYESSLIEKDKKIIVLEGAALREAYLRNLNLREVDLRETNLNGADLVAANLSGADLSSSDLSKAYLILANLSNANLSGTSLSGADLRFAYLNGANLNRTGLSEANLSEVDLSGSNLSKVNFYQTNLSKANLKGTNLSGASFSGTELSGAELSGADLSGARLYQSNLSGANLVGAKVTPEQLAKAKSLKGATMPDGSIHP